MVVKDDTIYVYYTGTNVRHGDKTSKSDWAIGLATLPADRFVALKPKSPGKEAIVETHPLRFEGDTLIINANGRERRSQGRGAHGRGEAIPGFDRNACKLIPRDNLRSRVTWTCSSGDQSLGRARIGNKPFRLRFILSDHAELFSFAVE